MADGCVPVVVSPVPFTRQIHDLAVREGVTVRAMLTEAVEQGLIEPTDLARTSVYVDGVRLDREGALDVVLVAGSIVNVVVEPLGGGGGRKDVGQILLQVAVIVVSAWVGGPAGPLAAMSNIARTVASASVMAVGQAAAGALFAPDRESQAKANDRYALQNASNQYRPWAPFPLALGEVVVAPDLAVKTFTQAKGDDVWIHGILGLHYGPCEVSEEKIGDTLISTMGPADVRIVKHLTPGPRKFQLHPHDVDQLDLTEELEATVSSSTPVRRAASSEGERFEFDFFLPGGLHFRKDDGRVLTASVTITIRYRAVDEDGNPVGSGAWTNGLTIPLSSTTKDPWRVTRSMNLPMGRYEFEVSRSTKPDNNEKRIDRVAWTAVRAIAFRKPITDETLSVIEFAVRATALNQGTLAPITCRIVPIAETWDPQASQWTAPQPTSNPAALTRWLLSGPAPVRPEEPSRVDVGLRAWSPLCDQYDWTANLYLTEFKTQAEAMALLEQSGRAGLFWDGTQIVASPWVEKPAPVQLFAGDNLRDHKWTVAYVEPVHALRVEFQNIEQGGEPDELYVYADGYGETADPTDGVEAAVLVEALRLEGQRTQERAYRDGRWELGRRLHQRRIDTWSCDIEQLACRYGSRVRLAWQRVDGGVSARVRVRRWSGSLISGLRLTQPVTMQPGESYAVDLRRVDGVDTAVPIINAAVNGPVTTRDIAFAAPRPEADSPRAGDLIAFGVATRVSEDVEIIGIEPGENLTATLTGVRYVAPLLMAGETGPIPPLQTRLSRERAASPPPPRLLGVQPDPAGIRVSFEMPPWSGSPITGLSARWRPTPPEGLETGWTALPPLDASANTLITPPPRALPAPLGDAEGATRIDIEIRAITAAGQTSPVPLLVSAIEVREEPFAPVNFTVTAAVRHAPGGSSHGVLAVSAEPLAVAIGVEMILEVRRYPPEGGAPDEWESAGLPLAASNPVGDILGLRSGTAYGVRGAWRTAGGWPSQWTAEIVRTVPAGSYVADDTVNVGGQAAEELLADLAAARQGVLDLEQVYGDTASAAASAATAAAEAAAATLAKADAIEAKEDALEAAGASATFASQAGGYKNDAETAAAAASADKLAAQAARDDAEDAASASAASESVATAKASEAASSAAAALADKLAAQTARAGAEGARGIAVEAKEDAEGAASTAAAQQALATTARNAAESAASAASGSASLASSKADEAGTAATAASAAKVAAEATFAAANVAAAMQFPDRYDGTAGSYFTGARTPGPDAVAGLASNATAAGFGPVYERSYGASATTFRFCARGVLPAIAGRVYKLEGEFEQKSGAPATFSLRVRGMNGDYSDLGVESASTNTAGNGAVQVISQMFSDVASGSDIRAWPAGAVWLRPFINSVAADSAIQFRRLTVTDVTEQVAAGNRAAAAALSASQASSAADAAGASASSASGSANTASTHAGNALAYRNQAADSAASAEGSASAASVSAGVAASVGNRALNKDAAFNNWSSPTALADWTAGGGGSRARTTGEAGQYALQQIGPAGTEAFVHQTGEAGSCSQGQYFVVEGHFRLDSGTLDGAGVLFREMENTTTRVSHLIPFKTDTNNNTGVAIGNGVAGRTYRFAKLVKTTHATADRWRLHAMNHWNSFGSVAAANQLTWFLCAARPATAEEIAAGVALPALQGTVSTLAATTADHTTKLATARLDLIAAASGGRPARIGIYSDNHGGGNVALDAAEIWFGDNTVFDDATNTLRTTIGSNVRVLAFGSPFGAASNLIDWYGPSSVALGAMTTANGINGRMTTAPYAFDNVASLTSPTIIRATALVGNFGRGVAANTAGSVSMTVPAGGAFSINMSGSSLSLNDGSLAQAIGSLTLAITHTGGSQSGGGSLSITTSQTILPGQTIDFTPLNKVLSNVGAGTVTFTVSTTGGGSGTTSLGQFDGALTVTFFSN